MRTIHAMFYEKLNTWMLPLKMLAPFIGSPCLPAEETNKFVAIERELSASISNAFDKYRKISDSASEQLFCALYGTDGNGG